MFPALAGRSLTNVGTPSFRCPGLAWLSKAAGNPPGMCSPLSMLHTKSNSPSPKGWFSASVEWSAKWDGFGRGLLARSRNRGWWHT